MLLKAFITILPWFLKRWLLVKLFGYEIHPTAYIGLSFIYPSHLIMKKEARIGHLNVGINLDCIKLGIKSSINRGNWITGYSTLNQTKHFIHQKDRVSELDLGDYSAITKNHHLDCTHYIKIGKYSTLAGYQSQLLTHSVDVFESRQHSAPIIIGDYTFIGTNVVILGNSSLPSFSVLGAKSLLNKNFTEEWFIYAGNPARSLKTISKEAKYFSRAEGFIV